MNDTTGIYLAPTAFEDTGGWLNDSQFIDTCGTPYLLAHGLGTPVADAATRIRIQKPAQYRIWVYTRNWVAPWKPAYAPGVFRLRINGRFCEPVFGENGADWHWQDGGVLSLMAGDAEIALHDLTGFEGRCGGILLTRNLDFIPDSDPSVLAALRTANGLDETQTITGTYDLIVAGGGITGMACAVTASRAGLKTALVHDRPVYGGNNSSEVRVWLSGKLCLAPFSKLGLVTQEFEQQARDIFGIANRAENYKDNAKLRILQSETNLTLYTGFAVTGAEVDGGIIRSVTLMDIRSCRSLRIAAPLFADCTGDGTLGYLSGADYEMTTSGHMELSNFWAIEDTGANTSFPRCPWAIDLTEPEFPERLRAGGTNPDGEKKAARNIGCWYWGAGFEHHPIQKAEYARDTNFRAMYGAWDAMKNIDRDFQQYKIAYSAHISGKRESRRLLGDLVLTKQDLLQSIPYDDGIVGIVWGLDLHTPNRKYYPAYAEGDAFICSDGKECFNPPYFMPYRCLYSRRIGNLFMGGRCISVTHDALGPVRVMRTCGMMGEVVGTAASICHAQNISPRDVYQSALGELTARFR